MNLPNFEADSVSRFVPVSERFVYVKEVLLFSVSYYSKTPFITLMKKLCLNKRNYFFRHIYFFHIYIVHLVNIIFTDFV